MIHLVNFLDNSVKNAVALKIFLRKRRSYEELINPQTNTDETQTPRNLLNYILREKRYRFNIYVNKPNIICKSLYFNSQQVFDSIFKNQKLQSYKKFFKRISLCKLPIPENLFFIYYTAQTLYSMIQDVGKEYTKIGDSTTKIEVAKTLLLLDKTYSSHLDVDEMLDEMLDGGEKFIIPKYNHLCPFIYTEDIFLNPNKLLSLTTDFGDIKWESDGIEQIIVHLLTYKGKYELPKSLKTLCEKLFKPLLHANLPLLKHHIANSFTLKKVANNLN